MFTARTKALVDERDAGRCQRCGRNVMSAPFSRHHRKPRGMGGGNRADANRLSNVVTLCGSATTPGSCHQWVETNRAEAKATGWIVSSWDDPAPIPMTTRWGYAILLRDDGGVDFTAPPALSPGNGPLSGQTPPPVSLPTDLA